MDFELKKISRRRPRVGIRQHLSHVFSFHRPLALHPASEGTGASFHPGWQARPHHAGHPPGASQGCHRHAIHGLARDWPEWSFHFSDGGSRDAAPEIAGNFHRYPFVSYARHLSRYTAVIHHGGTGILLECLSRGVPAIVMPLDFDHFDNAARLTHLGLAARVNSTSELPAAFSTLAGSGVLRETCEKFRDEVVAGYDAGETVRELVAGAFGGK